MAPNDLFILDVELKAMQGNIEPLAQLVDAGDSSVLECPNLRSIVAKLIRGESLKGRGRPRRNEAEARRIAGFVVTLHALGIPVRANGNKQDKDACDYAGEVFKRNPDRIRRMWKKHKKSLNGHLALAYAEALLDKMGGDKNKAIADFMSPYMGNK